MLSFVYAISALEGPSGFCSQPFTQTPISCGSLCTPVVLELERVPCLIFGRATPNCAKALVRSSGTHILFARPERASRVPRYSYSMDLSAIITGLREERDLVEQAISSFEHLAAGQGKRRGRPPAWMKRIADAAKGAGTPKRKRGRPANS